MAGSTVPRRTAKPTKVSRQTAAERAANDARTGRPARTVPVSQDALFDLSLAVEKVIEAMVELHRAHKAIICDSNSRLGRAS